MTSKLVLYGALARALHYQAYRRQMEHRVELLDLGVIRRWFPTVAEWWNS